MYLLVNFSRSDPDFNVANNYAFLFSPDHFIAYGHLLLAFYLSLSDQPVSDMPAICMMENTLRFLHDVNIAS